MRKHTKKRSYVKEVQSRKDYAGTEASPYREWLDNRGDYNQEHEAEEPNEANPDMLDEDQGIWFQSVPEDDRLDLIYQVMESLTDKQKEILRLCGNEGRTIENASAILKVSRGTIQKTLDRIRTKVHALQKAIK